MSMATIIDRFDDSTLKNITIEKLFINNNFIVEKYSVYFQQGHSAITTWIEEWLNVDFSKMPSSLFSVIQANYFWQQIMNKLSGTMIYMDEHRSWRNPCDYDPTIVGMKGPMIAFIGNSSVLYSEVIETLEMMLTEIPIEASDLFPSSSNSIPMILTTTDKATIGSIHKTNDMYEYDIHTEYPINQMDGRVLFILDVIKMTYWINKALPSEHSFHLVPLIRHKTASRHYVTWKRDGIVKEYNPIAEGISIDVLSDIYEKKLLNVEHGKIDGNKTIISRIGKPIRQVMSGTPLNVETIVEETSKAIQQLHSIGYAHCDISIDNIFIDRNGLIFLGDLEYCRLLHMPPPTHLGRSNSQAKTAMELDIIQLRMLSDDFLPC